jgi:hypothetical protein
MHDFRQVDSVNVTASNKRFKNSPLTVGKDVSSHDFTVVGKPINSFPGNSGKRQVNARRKPDEKLGQKKNCLKIVVGVFQK